MPGGRAVRGSSVPHLADEGVAGELRNPDIPGNLLREVLGNRAH